MQYTYEEHAPAIDADAFVCDEATLIGEVSIAANVSVWPGAVLRGDFGPVTVGERSHIEDNAVVHEATIGDNVIVGHGAVLNAATIEDEVIVGINSTVNMDVHVGSRCIVAPNAVIPQGRDIPSESIVRGVPGEVIPIDETGHDIEHLLDTYSADRYVDAAASHADLFGQ